MNYDRGYEWGISKAALGGATSLSSFSITIKTTVGTSTTGSSLYIDLIGANPVAGFTSTSGNSENGLDFWASKTGYQDQLGAPKYGSSYGSSAWDNKYYTTITFAVGSKALADLNYDLATYGGFNIAFDPNCTYTTSSLKFNYTVPDTTTTAVLLGMSFLGLMVFRRKLALN